MNFYWDLGVDWNAVVNETGISNLPSGMGSKTGLWTPMGLTKGDTVTFRVFDITKTPAGLTEVELDIQWAKALVTGNPHPPFVNHPSSSFPLEAMKPQMSLALVGTFPLWQAQPVSLVLGAYQLSFSVKCTKAPIVGREFFDDPEMVVGEDQP